MELNSNQSSRTPQLRLILHTNWPFCIRRWECVGWMINEAYLDFTALIVSIHPHRLTTQDLHAPYTASHGPANTPEAGISPSLWCSVGSSHHAELSFEPLQRAGGDHLLCYYSHWVQCWIVMCVELCFAPAGQPMELPPAVHSIPRTSETLPPGLLLWDLGPSQPHRV